jgi:hypothetical protein
MGYRCAVCRNEQPTQGQRDRHEIESHPFACGLCDKRFGSREEQLFHQEIMHVRAA